MTQVMLAVGTKKGLFLGWSSDRDTWEWEGPHHSMAAVAAVAIDTRRSPARLMVGGRNEHWGPAVFTSDDRGGTWAEEPGGVHRLSRRRRRGRRADLAAAARTGESPGRGMGRGRAVCALPLRRRWSHLRPGARSVGPPASPGLAPRRGWAVPAHGAAAPDRCRARVMVAMSTGGVYVTEDAGASWNPSNRGVRSPFLPDADAGVRAVRAQGGARHRRPRPAHAAEPRRRLPQRGRRRLWQQAEEGLPAIFGFGLTRTPGPDGAFFLFPLSADMSRFPVDGRAGVYRSVDGGRAWSDSSTGLPDSGFHTIVLRDALTTDDADPAGVYFGTRSGEVWGSSDGGIELEPARQPPTRRSVRSRGRPAMTACTGHARAAIGARRRGRRSAHAGGRDGRPEPTVGRPARPRGWSASHLVRRLRTESGQLRRHVNVYADGADVRGADGTATVLGQNAVVLVLPSVAGG